MFTKAVVLWAIVIITIAEPPVSSGPYPPSGWKPKGAPFTLPREFLPQQATNVEITREKVEFAGQLVETTTVLPSNSYLPPGDDDNNDTDFNTTEDLLKVQGLPANVPSTFNQQPQQPSSDGGLNQQEYIPPRAQNNFQPQSNPQFGQYRQQQQRSRQQQQQFAQRQPVGKIQQQQFNYQRQQQQQLGQLNEQQFGSQNTQQQEQGQEQEQESQVQQFGQPENTQFSQGQPQATFAPQPGFAGPQPGFAAPQPGFAGPQPGFANPQAGFVPQFGPRQTPTQTYGPPRAGAGNAEDDDDDDDDDNNEAAGQAAQLNAAPNNFQPSMGTVMALSNGRYYVLTPDNTLQRVLFMTSQTEDEARTNGFTAQLRYMPVEPIRDPIYTYNEKGQLTRIFKK